MEWCGATGRAVVVVHRVYILCSSGRAHVTLGQICVNGDLRAARSAATHTTLPAAARVHAWRGTGDERESGVRTSNRKKEKSFTCFFLFSLRLNLFFIVENYTFLYRCICWCKHQLERERKNFSRFFLEINFFFFYNRELCTFFSIYIIFVDANVNQSVIYFRISAIQSLRSRTST